MVTQKARASDGAQVFVCPCPPSSIWLFRLARATAGGQSERERVECASCIRGSAVPGRKMAKIRGSAKIGGGGRSSAERRPAAFASRPSSLAIFGGSAKPRSSQNLVFWPFSRPALSLAATRSAGCGFRLRGALATYGSARWLTWFRGNLPAAGRGGRAGGEGAAFSRWASGSGMGPAVGGFRPWPVSSRR